MTPKRQKKQQPAAAGGAAPGAPPVALYGLTIFSSAFLLFQVQPVIAKYILPWYGGSQAVWTVSLLFFQAFLLAGYLYAHLLGKIRSATLQAATHSVLLAASLVFLPIVPGEGWRDAGSGDPTWGILGLLAATIGLPYLLLASTSPLTQAWMARGRSGSPYRFYALSNLGSLLGLVTYPFLVEPALTRPEQASMWSWGMGGFVVVGILTSLASMRFPVPRGQAGGAPAGGASEGGPVAGPKGPASAETPARVGLWLLLPALASVLLLATTNKLVQELVAIPFLWILPLTVYLLSFILTFDSPRWYRRGVFVGILAASFGGVLWFLMMREDPPLLISVAFYLAALFAGCMVCHGELVRLKPPSRRLTSFYLSLAAGGALGGFFTAIVAPALFDTYLEYPLTLAAIPLVWIAARLLEQAEGRGPALPRPLLAPAAGAAALFALALLARDQGGANVIARDRNFYGTLSTAEYGTPGTKGHHRTMRHGRILHGLQYLHPTLERTPTAYFTPHSGVGLTLARYPRPGGRGLRIGVIGLGVGTLAAWTRPGDTIRYYEINPAVETMAREHFTFLGKSAGREEVALGDGRLVLEREPPQRFDVLVLDAFNNDSPPLHLLTRESFQIYLRHLKPDGAIAVNITSKYINFVPVISALAEHFRYPWTTVIDYNREDDFLRTVSFWGILTRNGALLSDEAIGAASNQPVIAERVPLWTDDYAPLFKIVEW